MNKIIYIIAGALIAFILSCLLYAGSVYAFELSKEEVNRLADSIYLAEGGNKTNYPYGVKSIKCKNGENGGCRVVTIRSIKNNIKRYNKQLSGKAGDIKGFIIHMGKRWCPPSAHKLNVHWVKNVHYYMNK